MLPDRTIGTERVLTIKASRNEIPTGPGTKDTVTIRCLSVRVAVGQCWIILSPPILPYNVALLQAVIAANQLDENMSGSSIL